MNQRLRWPDRHGADKHALIADDEIASGGTLMAAMAFLLDRGALSVEAAAVHPVLSGQAVQRIAESPLRSLVVTDSIPLPPGKRIDRIEVCSVTRLFADAIQAIRSGSSISTLFR